MLPLKVFDNGDLGHLPKNHAPHLALLLRFTETKTDKRDSSSIWRRKVGPVQVEKVKPT